MALLRRARKDTSMAALVAAHQRHIALECDDSDSDEEQKLEQKPPAPVPALLRRPQHALVLGPFDERDEERGGADNDDNDDGEEEEEWPASDRSRQSPHAVRVATAEYYRHDTDDDDDSSSARRQRTGNATARAAAGSRHTNAHMYAPSPPKYERRRSVRFSEADTVTLGGSDDTMTPDSDDRDDRNTRRRAHGSQHALYHYGPRHTNSHTKRATKAYAEPIDLVDTADTRAATQRPLRPSAKVSAALRKPMQLMRERRPRPAIPLGRSSIDAPPIDIDAPTNISTSTNSIGATNKDKKNGLVHVDAAMIAYMDATLVKPNRDVFNRYTRFFLDAALERLYQEYTAIKWFPRAQWHILLLMFVHVLVLLLFSVLPSSGFEHTDQFVLASDAASTYVQWLYLAVALPFALVPRTYNPCQRRWRVWACAIVVVFNWTFQLWLAHAGHTAISQFTAIVDEQLVCTAVNAGRMANGTRTVRASPNGTAIGTNDSSYMDVDSSWFGPTAVVNSTRPYTPAELAAKTDAQRAFLGVATALYAGALTQILTGFAWLFSFTFAISIRLEFVYVVVVGASAVATYTSVVLAFELDVEWLTTFAYSFALALLGILSRSADLTNRRSFLSTFVVERENESLQSSLHRAEAALMNEPAGPKEREVVEQVLDGPEMRAVEAFRIPFSDLKFLEAIGRGAMGDVIKAKYLGTVVVCKRIRREHITAATLESFRAEIVLMASLRHPNIVQFIGASWDNYSNLCIVMEYLENGDMHSVLHASIGARFTWADPLLKMALDIVQGMLYLHSQEPPIVHRDLKSVNVLCSKTFGCNVGDFGLSRRYKRSDVNPLKTLVGTPFWLAPEIIRQERYGPAADIYSFGIVLTELETRKTPYHELGDAARQGVKVLIRIAHDNVRPTLPPTCLPTRKQLITDCLLADPAQRPTFAAILTRLQGDVQREIEEDATRATLIERRTMFKQSHATPP